MNDSPRAFLAGGCARFSFLAGVAVWAAVTAAADVKTLPAESFPGRKARLANVDHLLVAADGVTTNLAAGPGRVQVQAFLRFNGKGQAYRLTPFTLSVGAESVSLPVDALAAGVPLNLVVVNRGTMLPITLLQGTLTPEAKTEALRLATAVGTARGPDLDLGAPEQGGGQVLAELDAIGGEPVNASAVPQPMVLLDRIEVTPRSGPLIVSAVTGDKITYRPAETATVTVVLENLESAPASGKLCVDLLEGLTNRTPVYAGDVTVDALKQAKQSFRVPLGTAPWGRGLEARLETSKGHDVATHACSVVTNPFMVAIFGPGLPMFGSERWDAQRAEQEAERIAAGNLANYCSAYEAFAWAPCDFSRMTVDNDEPFHSGQTQYTKRRSTLQVLHRVFHKYGIACITYGKSCASGLPGMEYALKHPEQMNVYSSAGFCHEAISVDILDRMLENRYRRHGRDEDFWQSWISAWTLMGNLDAANYGCDEIVRSAKQFGWDGVRYDGHFSVWNNPAMSARFVRHAANRIQSQVPGFGVGYNYCGPQHGTPEGAFADIEMAACARGGGLIMSEYYRNLLGPVKANIEHLRWAGDATRLHGGYFLAINDDRSDWSAALMLAGGARPMGGVGLFNKFATRFSAYVLDPGLRRLEDPAKVVTPGRGADFRWDAFVFEKPVSSTESLLILQLVNVTDRFAFSGQYRPPTGVSGPRRDVEFELTLPAGYQAVGAQAWEAAGEPAPLAAALAGNRLTIPRLNVWTMAVVTLRKAAGAPDLVQFCELPLRFDRAKAGTQEEARADLKIGAAVGPDAVKAINAAKVKITPAVLDAVLAQGEPEDNNPGLRAYAPPVFTNHKARLDAAWLPREPSPLHLRRDGRPDVLLVRGVFSHVDRLDEGLAGLPGVEIHDAYLKDGRTACGSVLASNNVSCLAGWPGREALAGMDVVVLDDIPAPAFSPAERRDLLDFVQGGGRLLVLGGWYSLSKGAWEGSFLEDALPVETVQATHLLRLKADDRRLAAVADAPALLGRGLPDFGTRAAVEWLNPVRLRQGAKVVMTAGTQPVLVAGDCGRGRVFVWTGSHSGTPEAPYWQNAAWPRLLSDVLLKLAEGSDAVTAPDPDSIARLAKARETLAGEAMEALAGDQAGAGSAASQAAVLDGLRFLLAAGGEQDALAVATYLLENPGKVDPAALGELTDAIAPKITASEGWAQLGERTMNEPPHLLGGLVAEIAAVALKSVKFGAIQSWRIEDPVTRLRCIAASGDPAALPVLEAELRQIGEQEARWAALVAADNYSASTVHDIYETRLRRPFIAYAMIKCGKRDEETLTQFCRGVLELPYYAWRQRWILEGAYGSLAEAGQSGDRAAVAAAKGRIREAQGAVRRLDRAIRYATPLFQADALVPEAAGCRAAARALKAVDCHKALPLALAFLKAIPREKLPAFEELDAAQLDGIRFTYQAMRASRDASRK